MRVLIAIALACCLSAVGAASEPPIDKGQSASTTYGLRDNNQRGTRDNPIVVEARSPEPSDAKAQKEEAEKAEHAHAESVIATGTASLAVITAVLAVATIVLGYFTYRLWSETKSLREGADAQGKENTRIATRQLGLSGRQLRLLESQTELMEKQKEIARLQYFATHRPRLVVRRVSMRYVMGIPSAVEHVAVEFIVANIGNSAATIKELSALILTTDTEEPAFDAIPPYAESSSPGIALESGGSAPIVHREHDATTVADFRFRQGVALTRNNLVFGQPAFFLGYIQYEDSLGNRRRTAFMRRYDFATERCTPVGDPDYEYQD